MHAFTSEHKGAFKEKGFTLYRSDNNIATTIEYIDEVGGISKIEVLDGIYRGVSYDEMRNAKGKIMDATTGPLESVKLFVDRYNVDGLENVSFKDVDYSDLTNEFFYNLVYGKVDKLSATEIYDYYCENTENPNSRNLSDFLSNMPDLNNGEWVPPTLYQSMVIYAVSDFLDEFDPTVSDPSYRLGETRYLSSSKNGRPKAYFNLMIFLVGTTSYSLGLMMLKDQSVVKRYSDVGFYHLPNDCLLVPIRELQ